MKIAEIRSALASRAQAMNIAPVKPIEGAPITLGTVAPVKEAENQVVPEKKALTRFKRFWESVKIAVTIANATKKHIFYRVRFSAVIVGQDT